jgi:acetoin utilization deacetylase AcuC-like enzyme
LQCGADSLAGDELGDFNLTSHGHGACIKKVLGLNIPVVLLGGGGYNVVNVAKCWTSHTALVLNQEINENIPSTDSFV